MLRVLREKKVYVARELVRALSHKNRDDMESALNASSVLIELVESEKTLEIFMDDDAKLIGEIIDLAVDQSNSHNQ